MKHVVLFVDDNPVVLRTLCELFSAEPYSLFSAKTGEEALQLIKEGLRPAVIVSDQMMPGMDGCEFFAKSRKVYPDAARIMLTAYSDFEAAMDAINKCGLYRFLLKPWDGVDLKQTVHDAVSHHDLVYENRRLAGDLQKKNEQLKQLNAQLEGEIDDQVQALKLSYEENISLTRKLERKIVELEGQDRILHHLLTIHDLEDSLHITLEVIRKVAQVQWAAVYLPEENSTEFNCAAMHGDIDLIPEYFLSQEVIEQVLIEKKPRLAPPVNEISLLFIPVLKEEQCLAVAAVARQLNDNLKLIDDEVQASVEEFMVFLAIAISDAKTIVDLPPWDTSLDDVLRDYLK